MERLIGTAGASFGLSAHVSVIRAERKFIQVSYWVGKVVERSRKAGSIHENIDLSLSKRHCASDRGRSKGSDTLWKEVSTWDSIWPGKETYSKLRNRRLVWQK